MSSSATGRVGEHFAAYVLEAHGIEAQRVDTQYADLWCRVGDSLIAVEVKTCSSAKLFPKRGVTSRYSFNSRSKKHGWFCFVALDIRLMLLRPVEEIGKASSISLSSKLFTPESQSNSIEKFLKSC